MEALIITAGALLAIVLLEAGYWIAISLMRWAPVILLGALAGYLADNHGADALGALGAAALVCALARHILRDHHFR